MGNKKWSELHLDILYSILKKVGSSVADIIRLKAICSSWNCAVKSYLLSPYNYMNHDQAPLLMHPNFPNDPSIVSTNPNEEDTVYFFSMAEKKVYKINYVFEEDGSSYSKWSWASSSYGWLVVWHMLKRPAWLLNPISGSRIQLPMISTLVDCYVDVVNKRCGKITLVPADYHYSSIEIIDAVVSCDPSKSKNNNFVVVVIFSTLFSDKTAVGFCKPGDNAWTLLGYCSDCCSMEFHNGQLFTLFIRGDSKILNDTRVRIWDLRFGDGETDYCNLMKSPIVVLPGMDSPPSGIIYRTYYLVESGGELLLVEKSRVPSMEWKPKPKVRSFLFRDEHGNISIKKDKYGVDTSVHSFRVFKLNLSSNKWEDVKYLHHRALCLNGNRSGISISTLNFQEFEQNSIYFTYEKGYIGRMLPGHHSEMLGLVYNLETKLVKTFYKYNHVGNPGMWIVLNPW